MSSEALRAALERDELLTRLNDLIDDPMWADHAEISKKHLRQIRAALLRAPAADGWREKSLRVLLSSLLNCVEPHAREPSIVQVKAGFASEFWATITDLATYATPPGSAGQSGGDAVDAQRYRWLRGKVDIGPSAGGHDRWSIVLPDPGVELDAAKVFDAAIDAAMQAKEG